MPRTSEMTDKLVVGTDEAGYGPNLGPLVITATAWQIPSDLTCPAMWDVLGSVLTSQPAKNDRRLFIADSKQVYSPASGLIDLETGVLSFLKAIGSVPSDVRILGKSLAGDRFEHEFAADPSARGEVPLLPIEASVDEIDEFSQNLITVQQRTGIQLRQIRSRVIFPTEFNLRVREANSKGVVLSDETLGLIRDLVPDSVFSDPPTSVQVFCDKHGGRNRYDELISETFGDRFVFRLEESTAISRYKTGPIEFTFRTKAEELLPCALASMVAKYLRETLMLSLNSFWKQHVPDLKPTKGYPLDAKRFRSDIAEAALRLGIAEDQYWRIR